MVDKQIPFVPGTSQNAVWSTCNGRRYITPHIYRDFVRDQPWVLLTSSMAIYLAGQVKPFAFKFDTRLGIELLSTRYGVKLRLYTFSTSPSL